MPADEGLEYVVEPGQVDYGFMAFAICDTDGMIHAVARSEGTANVIAMILNGLPPDRRDRIDSPSVNGLIEEIRTRRQFVYTQGPGTPAQQVVDAITLLAEALLVSNGVVLARHHE